MHRSLFTNDSRRTPREMVFWPTQIDGCRLKPTDALIVNLSPSGCMVRSEAIVAPIEQVTLTLPVVGHTEAKVMWVLGGRIGLEFAIILPLHSYLPMLHEMKADNA